MSVKFPEKIPSSSLIMIKSLLDYSDGIKEDKSEIKETLNLIDFINKKENNIKVNEDQDKDLDNGCVHQ